MGRGWFALVLLVAALVGERARAQESGGSFGGYAEDEPLSGGASTGYGGSSSSYGGSSAESRRRSGSGGSDWFGGSSSSSSQDLSEGESEWGAHEHDERIRHERDESARRAAEARRAEAAARAAEAAAADRATKLAMPPAERIAALEWPAVDDPSPSEPLALDAPLSGVDAARPGPNPLVHPHVAVTRSGEVSRGFGICGLVPGLLLLVATLVFAIVRRASPPPPVTTPDLEPPTRVVDTAWPPRVATPSAPLAMRVSIAFDWTARPELQRRLATIASSHDMRRAEGLAAATRAVTTLLAQRAEAARYATWEHSRGAARDWMVRKANDLRARFRAELVRNERTADAPAFVARESEGAGLVVVSVLVLSRTGLGAPPARVDASALAEAISLLGRASVRGLEVIWSPAAENDRMSSYELEKLYPELVRFREGVGGVACPYCRAPRPAELTRCPACGATSIDEVRSRP